MSAPIFVVRGAKGKSEPGIRDARKLSKQREIDQMLRVLTLIITLIMAVPLHASPMSHSFASIDGGQLGLSAWKGQPVLVVNTASRCGYTGQYEGLQKLYDTYRAQGLVVLAVPSDDFRQELDSAAEVKEFCELTYGIDMPMADITHVRGRSAHPFYREVRAETGFEPSWNFNKVLIGRDGRVAGTWGSNARPLGRQIVQAIEAELKK
jgi:glutathione peroxidase